MSSGGYWLRGSLVSAGSRALCSIISLCSMYTSKESLATIWTEQVLTRQFSRSCTNSLVLEVNNCLKKTHISFFVLWQQLVDGVSKQTRIPLCILTDALHQLWVFFSQIVQFHKERHLLPVGQRHLNVHKVIRRATYLHEYSSKNNTPTLYSNLSQLWQCTKIQ